MLFSGTDNHLAGLGQMAEMMKMSRGHFDGKPGYEGVLNQVRSEPLLVASNSIIDESFGVDIHTSLHPSMSLILTESSSIE